MWRWALLFLVFAGPADGGQIRSNFQVGLTITGRVSTPAVGPTLIPLPRPRPAAAPALTNSQGKSSLAANGK